MASPLRTPPRFVPTLTTVVEPESDAAEADAGAGAGAEVDAPKPQPASPSPTQSTQPIQPTQPTPDQVALSPSDAALSDAYAFRFEEQLLHRVLQRIDLSLETRLTDVVSAAVQRQLDAMVPQLRLEIEDVLRALVIEALADELPQNLGSAPIKTPQTLG